MAFYAYNLERVAAKGIADRWPSASERSHTDAYCEASTMKRRQALWAATTVLPVHPSWARDVAAGSPTAKASLTLRAREFLRLDGTDEDDGFAALVDEIGRYRRAVTVHFGEAEGVLALSGRRGFALPTDVRWDFGRTRLQTRAQLGSNTALLNFGERSLAMGLRVELLPGSKVDRLVILRDDTRVEQLDVTSAEQLRSGEADNLDGLLQIRGSRVMVRDARFSGVDKPLMVLGAGATRGNTRHLEDVRIDGLRVTSYVTGVHVRNAKGVVVRDFTAATRSPHASQLPGHNALLAGHVQDFQLEDFRIDDAGEHAIRIGGSPNADELINRGVLIGRGRIARAGKCGVKVWAGGKFEQRERGLTHDLKVHDVQAVDLGAGGRLGLNEDLLHLEAVRGFRLTNLGVAPEKASLSCHDGAFLAGCTDGAIEGLRVKDCARSAVWITDTVAKNDVWPVRDVVAREVVVTGARGDAIHLDILRHAGGRLSFSALRIDGAQRGFAGTVGGSASDLELHVEGHATRLRGRPLDVRAAVPVRGNLRPS